MRGFIAQSPDVLVLASVDPYLTQWVCEGRSPAVAGWCRGAADDG
jgi:hypothetical protein